jgi:DNA-binding LacI/PurR family transcriptional regulator
MATRMLIKTINEETEPDDELIKIMPHELIVRESSK